MALTPRFGLTAAGGNDGATIVDDGNKFTLEDRFTIDRVLNALERHRHNVLPGESLEPMLPTAALGTSGTLPPGADLYYSVSFVDRDGLETVGSEEVLVQTPAPIAPPGAPFVETTDGGTLPVGLYYYVLTALRGSEESTISAPVTAQVIPGDTTVLVRMPPPQTGTTGYRIWRMGGTESGYTRIGTAAAQADAIFVDDGSVPADPCACDPENSPPTISRGASIYSATVTLHPDDAALITTGRYPAWRLYRTDASGNYPQSSLVHEVVERQSGDPLDTSSPLLIEWVDLGAELAAGRPNLFDQSLAIQPFTFASGATLPDPARFPPGFPFVADGVLYGRYDGVWKALTSPPAVGLSAQHIRLTSANGTSFKLVGDVEVPGAVARPMPTVRPANAVVQFTDLTGTYQLGVGDDGTLALVIPTTTPGGPQKVTFTAVAPLLLPSVDPTSVLAVWTAGGALQYAEI
jgi:hypothetical protein